MTDPQTLYTIKDLSEKTGIPERTIAYYRDSYKGYLPAVIEPGNKTPKYTAKAVEVLQVIRGYIAVGKTKSEILEALAQEHTRQEEPQSATAQPNSAYSLMSPEEAEKLQAERQAQTQAIVQMGESFNQVATMLQKNYSDDQEELRKLREDNKALEIANAQLKTDLKNTKKEAEKGILSRLSKMLN